MSFEQFNLNPKLQNTIAKAKFDSPSTIQRLSIPEIIAGKDLIASSHTGTGKSASFVIPLINNILNERPEQPESQSEIESEKVESQEETLEASSPNDSDSKSEDFLETTKAETSKSGPKALILTPTREMANQITSCIRKFSKDCDIRYGVLIGGAPYPPQVRMLRRPIDLLVATPGRLLDHIKNDRVSFERTEYFVIDELNKMIEMGLANDLASINEGLDKKAQTIILASHIEGDEIAEISQQMQNSPVRFELARGKNSYKKLPQAMYIADDSEHRNKLIDRLVEQREEQEVLLVAHRESNYSETLQHLQNDESYTPAEQQDDQGDVFFYKNRKIRLLSGAYRFKNAEDNCASLQLINLDMPDSNERHLRQLDTVLDINGDEYEGEISMLINPDDWSSLNQIERFVGKTIVRKTIDGLEPKTSEPRVGSHQSKGQKSNFKTRNRNPYSGRRNSDNKNRSEEESSNKRNPRKKSSKRKNNNGGGGAPANGNPAKRNNANRRSRNRSGQNGNSIHGNQEQSYLPMTDDDMSWKQYLSNISSGNEQQGNMIGNSSGNGNGSKGKKGRKNANPNNMKSANKKFRKSQNKGYDLNHSPMASNQKAKQQNNDDWENQERETNKKTNVQIKVKGNFKQKIEEKANAKNATNPDDGERISGKLSINK